MKLTIRYLAKCLPRPWLLKREGGEYSQHAHLRTRKGAERVRRLIDASKYPYNKDYRIAMQRILTKEEWRRLNKRERYFNANKGGRK